jgi:hypothetical protein
MNVRQSVILMVVVTVLSWGGWLAVLFFIDPEATGQTGFFLFYLSIFFALTGTFSLIGFFARYLFTRQFPQFEKLQIAFRQALFFGIIFTSYLYMQANHLLTWLNALVLVFVVTILEFLIISLKKS